MTDEIFSYLVAFCGLSSDFKVGDFKVGDFKVEPVQVDCLPFYEIIVCIAIGRLASK